MSFAPRSVDTSQINNVHSKPNHRTRILSSLICACSNSPEWNPLLNRQPTAFRSDSIQFSCFQKSELKQFSALRNRIFGQSEGGAGTSQEGTGAGG